MPFQAEFLHLLNTLYPNEGNLLSPKQQAHRGHAAMHQDATAMILHGHLTVDQALFHVSGTDTRI